MSGFLFGGPKRPYFELFKSRFEKTYSFYF